MKRLTLTISILLIFSLVLGACTPETPTPAPPPPATETPAAPPPPAEDVLFLNILWHQHQPLYYKDDNGVYTRPWVRVHATKDYYDMASVVAEYPDVHVTFNLTPVLIRQLDDFAAGAKDVYWVLAEKPAAELTEADKRFILARFFDANWDKIIARYPRYKELLDKRAGSNDEQISAALVSFSEQDFRDLQVWFNLAWFDPDFLAQDPLKSLVEKGSNFSEEDKSVLFAEAVRIIQETIPLHKQLQDAGQIEVITTPYAHPILPLIFDSNLALVGNPAAEMPDKPFSYPFDAVAHLDRSVEIYTEKFGQAPRGLWPGEGSVAQEIVPLVANAGYQWMATGEPVLAQSLGIGSFTRDPKDTVQEADLLYRPYYVESQSGKRVAVFFRDWTISDKLGFTYSGVPGETAAKDLIQRLENIRARLKEEGAEGPHIVSIILDGENAWEHYPNDGKEFFHSLYGLLSESSTLQTITPSEYLARFPEQRKLDNLFPGAWFSPNYDTWIGESEERLGWEYLERVRFDLQKYEKGIRPSTPEKVARALDFMYLAEGSDWFWWYGTDQDSGQDSYFDEGYRALLASVYTALGEPVPAFVSVPIIPKRPVAAERDLLGLSSPVIDGNAAAGEWDNAAYYPQTGAEAAGIWYTIDTKNIYLRIDFNQPPAQNLSAGFYLAIPRQQGSYPFTRSENETGSLIGFAANRLVEIDSSGVQVFSANDQGWQPLVGTAVTSSFGKTTEIALPLDSLGELDAGDDLRLAVALAPSKAVLPVAGPVQIVMPDLGLSTLVLEINDPAGDDNGPGTYVYPTDTVFNRQVFDLKSFSVSFDEKNLIFKFGFYGPVPNPWGSGINLSLQTLDVYVDRDPGAGTGARMLLPGRNAALEQGNGWDIAVWAEGWTSQVVAPDPQSGEPKQVTGVDFKVIVDPAARTVTIRVPRSTFGDGDPASWGYAAAVMSQEGFPAAGVWRVRDIEAQASQWRFGGAPSAKNHTRIIDLAWAEGAAPSQAEILGTFALSSADLQTLTANDFAQIKLILK